MAPRYTPANAKGLISIFYTPNQPSSESSLDQENPESDVLWG